MTRVTRGSGGGRGCLPRALAAVGLLALGTPALWLIGGHGLVRWQVRREERAWAETGRSMRALREQLPRTRNSAAAVGLDRLTQRLGIHLVPDAGRSSRVDDTDFHSALRKHLDRIAESTEEQPFATSMDERRFLDRQGAELMTVANYIVTTPGISWEMDIDAGLRAPLPSLLAHRSLQQVLVLAALDRDRTADGAQARLLMEAAWRHSETLASRPDTISQLIATSLALTQQAALRAMPEADLEWMRRLAARRFLENLIGGLQVEAYGWLALTREYRGAGDTEAQAPPPALSGGAGAVAVRVLSVPWLRLSATSISRHLRRMRALSLAGDPCELDGETIAAQVQAGIRRWDVLAKIAVPSLARSSIAGRDADLDAEWTGLILEARARMRESADWGDVSSVPSQVCPGVRWLHRREPDGRLTVAGSPEAPANPNRPQRWTFTLSRLPDRR